MWPIEYLSSFMSVFHNTWDSLPSFSCLAQAAVGEFSFKLITALAEAYPRIWYQRTLNHITFLLLVPISTPAVLPRPDMSCRELEERFFPKKKHLAKYISALAGKSTKSCPLS